MVFRRAESGEFEKIRDFYWNLIDSMAGGEYDPGWRKGIYPSDEELAAALAAGELYVLDDAGETAAAVVINGESNEGYSGVAWGAEIPPERVLLLHMLGVNPGRQRAGVGRRVVAESLALAERSGALCVRLDVMDGNLPAERLYLSMGFLPVCEQTMYYEDTGWMKFKIFEKIF